MDDITTVFNWTAVRPYIGTAHAVPVTYQVQRPTLYFIEEPLWRALLGQG